MTSSGQGLRARRPAPGFGGTAGRGTTAAEGIGSGAPERGNGRFDAIVVGAGHNGLVAAAYLARAGLDVVVLEGSPSIGGATRSEEAFPGFRFSVFSYLVSLLRPEVIHELDLVRHGLFLVPTASTLNPLPGGDCLFREADPQRTYRHIARHSRRDAEALFEYKLEMRRMGHLMFRLQRAAPDELAAVIGDRVGESADAGGDAGAPSGGGAEVADIARYFLDVPAARLRTFVQMLTMSSADFLDQWFESDVLKAALSSSSIIGSMLSPRSPGSAYVLLHHYMGEVDGAYREWGFQKGGTGAVAAAIGRAARSHGAGIRTNCRVDRVLVRGGRAAGVVLANGDELHADVVLSSAAPQISLGGLLDPADVPGDAGPGLASRAGRWRSRGCAGKVNLALDGLPRFECMPEPGPHLSGGITIAPGLDYVDRAYDEAKYGNFSKRPFIDMILPSVLDPDMAPPGKHVVSCFVQYAPYELASGPWDDRQRDAFGDAVVRTLEEYAPGIENRILHRQVLVPPDIERIAGIPGGNIFHGELRLSQLFLLRPDPAAASFRTPLPGYYLCGSSTQFGGGISGGPARLAALRVIDDLRGGGTAAPGGEGDAR